MMGIRDAGGFSRKPQCVLNNPNGTEAPFFFLSHKSATTTVVLIRNNKFIRGAEKLFK